MAKSTPSEGAVTKKFRVALRGFRPAGQGLQQVLGALEAEVMRLLWECPDQTVVEVEERLRRRREIAHTTVLTTLDRMYRKGYLTREKWGKAFVYTPRYTREELSGLLEHEAAHHVRRDNLTRWALTICRYSSPAFPLTGLLYRGWSEQVEMVCDEIAARHTKAPIEIAGALVRLKRLALAPMARVSQPTASDFFGEEGEGFEWRVARILSLADEPVTGGTADLSCSWAGPVAAGIASFVLSLATLFLVSPLAIHRAVEAVLP